MGVLGGSYWWDLGSSLTGFIQAISGAEHSRVAKEGSHSVRLDSWDIVPEDEIPQSCPSGDSPTGDSPSESDLTQSQKTATSEHSDLDSLQAVTEVIFVFNPPTNHIRFHPHSPEIRTT